MAQSGIVWTKPPSALNPAIVMYGNKVRAAVVAVALLIGAKMEAYAKANAPWTDRTANARQGLFYAVDSDEGGEVSGSANLGGQDSGAVSVAKDIVALYLSHSMSYGLYLEVAMAGRWRVVLPTMEAHYQELKQMLDGIFK